MALAQQVFLALCPRLLQRKLADGLQQQVTPRAARRRFDVHQALADQRSVVAAPGRPFPDSMR